MRKSFLVSDITTFLLFTFICAVAAGKNAPYYGPKKIVRVQNDINGIKLMVHCWSKDDDLGLKYLVKGQYTEWHFRNSFFMDTLFWCMVQWRGSPPHMFAAFKQLRDNPRCSLKCWWSIRRDGAYYFNEMGTQKYELMYPWKK